MQEMDRLLASISLFISTAILSLLLGGHKAFDARGWNIDLAFDSVHFSEVGHKAFAKIFLDKVIEE